MEIPPEPIDILLGMDRPDLFVPKEIRRSNINEYSNRGEMDSLGIEVDGKSQE